MAERIDTGVPTGSGPASTVPPVGASGASGPTAPSANAAAAAAAAHAAAAPDWTIEITGRVEHIVGVVRANTTDRLVKVARLLVFGLLAAGMGVTALVLLVVAVVRLLDVLLPRGVWLADLVAGAIFTAAGGFLWSKKTAHQPTTTSR